jgi:hypothetical protein
VRAYGKTELQRLVDAAYRRGHEDGRNLRTEPEPPSVDELIDHPMTGGDHPSSYVKRPWLANVKPGAGG